MSEGRALPGPVRGLDAGDWSNTALAAGPKPVAGQADAQQFFAKQILK